MTDVRSICPAVRLLSNDGWGQGTGHRGAAADRQPEKSCQRWITQTCEIRRQQTIILAGMIPSSHPGDMSC
jgi:hypothetical protein